MQTSSIKKFNWINASLIYRSVRRESRSRKRLSVREKSRLRRVR
jgi:hypothetical protein